MQQKNKRPSCQSLVSSCIYWVLFCMLSTLRSGHLKLAPGMVSMVHSRRIAIFVIRKSLWGFEFSYMSVARSGKTGCSTTSLSPRLNRRRFRALFPRVLRHGRLVKEDVGRRPFASTRPQCRAKALGGLEVFLGQFTNPQFSQSPRKNDRGPIMTRDS